MATVPKSVIRLGAGTCRSILLQRYRLGTINRHLSTRRVESMVDQVMATKIPDTFLCFYCGLQKTASERTGEHIIPESIGGNRNATFTYDVCAGCQTTTGNEVDLPFSRDWFIEHARLLGGVKPFAMMGRLDWQRQEIAMVFITNMAVTIFHLSNTADNSEKLVVALDPINKEQVVHTGMVLRRYFRGVPVINTRPHQGGAYDEELIVSLMTLGPELPMTCHMHIDAWEREIAKMALGLSCLVLGDRFLAGNHARLLRQFLFEQDPERRAALPIPRSVGVAETTKPRITQYLYPGGPTHLFCLLVNDSRIAFIANLFGHYENAIVVSPSEPYLDALPGSLMRGVYWQVDYRRKTTKGPRCIEQFLQGPTR